MGKIDELKYVIFDETCCEGKGGTSTCYYDSWGNTYDFLDIFEEIYSHFEPYFDEDEEFEDEDEDEEFEDEDEDEDEDEFKDLKELNANKAPTKEWLKNCYFDNGWLGLSCLILAEGKDIAKAAADFFRENFLDYVEEDDEGKILAIIEKAEQNPEDYDSVIQLLELTSKHIEEHNERAIG